MSSNRPKNKPICSSADLLAYVDGELSPQQEIDIEMHLVGCGDCRAELNRHKDLLLRLDGSLDSAPDLPPNFSKIVAANAESQVGGLRHSRERRIALLVCIALAVFGVFAFGAGSQTAVNGAGKIADQTIAIFAFIGHVIFDVAFGIAVIAKSLAGQIQSAPLFQLAIVVSVAGLLALIFYRRQIWFGRIFGGRNSGR